MWLSSVFACMVSLSQSHTEQHSADTKRRWINIGSTFVHHQRRWTIVKPTLIQCLVFTGLPIHMYGAYIICLSPLTAQQNKHSLNVALILGELHRRWSNIKPAKKKKLFLVKQKMSKWWYLLAVVHEALLCYCTRTPYTTKHLLCLDNAASLQMFYNHIASWNVLIWARRC